jgi:hypothetical protein
MGGNRRLTKVAVKCYADIFVVNQSLILRTNICDENRHLHQAPNFICGKEEDSIPLLTSTLGRPTRHSADF